MNFLLKTITILVGLILIIVSVWYFYFWKRFSTLQEVDRQQIIESLKKDSDGKGISDESKIQIERDLSQIKSLKKEEKLFFEKWYYRYIKMKRKTLLSKDRTEYLKNITLYYKSYRCFGIYISRIKEDIDFNFFNQKFEHKSFYELFYIHQKKNFRFLSFDQIYEIQNPKMTVDKCQNLEKMHNLH